MNESSTVRTITDLARPLAASLELAIWGVEVSGAVIQIYVEGENGVSIDACAELSRLLSLTLDVEDVIPGAYVLEVSSPGLERTFFTPEQLAAAVGEVVDITLHAPTKTYPDRKKLLGTLIDASGGVFSVALPDVPKNLAAEGMDGAPAVFAWDEMKKAKRVHFLPEKPKPAKGKAPGTVKPPREKTSRGGDHRDSATV